MVALAASLVARLHDGPQLLYALLFGVSFHFLHDDPKIKPGLAFCASTVLRWGVALLGARITASQVVALGWPTALTVVLCVASTVALGVMLARCLGMSRTQGLLSGGATAICGASAALAISAVLPRSREQERFTLMVVVTVTCFSTLAMLLYPLIARGLGLSPAHAGLFLGASIHDVAQVVGAGYLLGTVTGDNATVVKLFRVALLVVVVAAMSLAYARHHAVPEEGPHSLPRPALVPWFLWVFVLLVVLNSVWGIPSAVQPVIQDVARGCLLVAITGLGVKTSFQSLFQTGWRPLVLMLAETLWLAAAVLLAIFCMRWAAG